MPLRFVQSSKLPTQWGVFDLHGFEDPESNKEHIAISMGDVSNDVRCDCGAQLEEAMRLIAKEGRGAILYLRQEGRGIGLLNKIKAYHLQDQGADTVEANEQLGFGADMRDYSICKPMLKHLHVGKVKLLTNNPRKVQALEGLGITVSERIALQTGHNPHNKHYLATKAGKMGHLFDGQESG